MTTAWFSENIVPLFNCNTTVSIFNNYYIIAKTMHAATSAGGIYDMVVSNGHCDAVGTCESDQQRMFNTLFFNFYIVNYYTL